MKNNKILNVLTLSAIVGALLSCSVVKKDKIDSSKSQLYLYSYNGGYGSGWLTNAAKRYEELAKDKSFENGKTGVQIIITADKTNGYVSNTSSFSSDTNDIYFTENVSYMDLYPTGKLLDMTEIVNKVNPYDNKKIVDKIEDQYKSYLTRENKIYALPHYPGYYGIAYSIELFDKCGAYIDADGGITGQTGKAKGLGPNGKTGIHDGIDYTYDDGLPSTYDEFFNICNYLTNNNIVAINWSGKYADQHLNGLFRSLVADADGAEVSRMRSTLSGTPMVMKLDASNYPVKDGSGKLVLEQGNVSLSSRHDIYRTPSVYYAAEFMSRLTNEVELIGDVRDTSVTQYDAQESFINSNTEYRSKDENGVPHDFAMLIDGPWWESEGRSFFENCVNKDNGNTRYARENRKFGWLPLPKPTKDLVGKGNAVLDHLESFVIARKSDKNERNQMIEDFLLFINQDQELVNFAKDTGVKRMLKYDISEADLANSSSYVSSLANYLNDCNVVYPGVSDPHFNSIYKEVTTFDSLKKYFSSSINGNVFGPGYAFLINIGLTADQWFSNFYSTKKNS